MKRELLFLKHGYLNVAFLMLFGCCSVACSNEDDNPTPEPPKPVEVYQDLKVFQLNTWFGATQVNNAYNGLVDVINQVDPDIVLLCELRNDLLLKKIPDGDGEYTHRLCQSLKTKYQKDYYGKNHGTFVGVLSKYEIKSFKVLPAPTDNYMIKVTVEVRGQKRA